MQKILFGTLISKLEKAVDIKKDLVIAQKKLKKEGDSTSLVNDVSFKMNGVNSLLCSKDALIKMVRSKDSSLTILFDKIFHYLESKFPGKKEHSKAIRIVKELKKKTTE